MPSRLLNASGKAAQQKLASKPVAGCHWLLASQCSRSISVEPQICHSDNRCPTNGQWHAGQATNRSAVTTSSGATAGLPSSAYCESHVTDRPRKNSRNAGARTRTSATSLPRRQPATRGFTLAEALLALTITVTAGSAVILGITSSVQTSEIALEETIARGLAEQMMDEIAGWRYVEPSGDPYQTTLGPELGETAVSDRLPFDDVDDFTVLANNPPTDYWGVALGTDDGEGSFRHPEVQAPSNYLSGWSRVVDVYYANPPNFDTPLPGGTTSDHKVVVVQVTRTDSSGAVRELARLRRVFSYVPQP